jgi:hypothetical protein
MALRCGPNWFGGNIIDTQLFADPSLTGIYMSLAVGVACQKAWADIMAAYAQPCPPDPRPPSCSFKSGHFA